MLVVIASCYTWIAYSRRLVMMPCYFNYTMGNFVYPSNPTHHQYTQNQPLIQIEMACQFQMSWNAILQAPVLWFSYRTYYRNRRNPVSVQSQSRIALSTYLNQKRWQQSKSHHLSLSIAAWSNRILRIHLTLFWVPPSGSHPMLRSGTDVFRSAKVSHACPACWSCGAALFQREPLSSTPWAFLTFKNKLFT